MASVRAQVNELADLQGRSAALLALAQQNALVRASIGSKIVDIGEQLGKFAEVLATARLVANKVEGANERQTKHLDNLMSALEAAPTSADLERSVDELSAVVKGMDGQPPVSPPSTLSAVTPPFFPSAPPAGGYRYSRRRKTPTRKRKTPSRHRRKNKNRRRR